MATARRTLVAARVRVLAVPERAVIGRVNAGRRDWQATDDLIREVEGSLDRMQEKIDSLREDCDEAFKFPEPRDDGPRAA